MDQRVLTVCIYFSLFFLYPLVHSQYVLTVHKSNVTLVMVRPPFTFLIKEVLISKMCCCLHIKNLFEKQSPIKDALHICDTK